MPKSKPIELPAEFEQAIGATQEHRLDVTAYLRSGQTVSSATASHVPPSGTVASAVVGSIVSNVIPVTLGPLNADNPSGPTTEHSLDIDVTLASPAETPTFRLKIPVPF